MVSITDTPDYRPNLTKSSRLCYGRATLVLALDRVCHASLSPRDPTRTEQGTSMTEVWFRNPQNYIRELVETRARNVAWDRGMLHKRRIDPYTHANLYFSKAGIEDWRVLLVGSQGTAELRRGFNVDNPVGVYPTWEGTESLELLEEMMAYPIGEDSDACNDPNIQIDERPVAGQEHRVLVTNLPSMTTGPGRALIRKLKELQEDYPECILHIHGVYSHRINFGMGFRSADVDPRTNAGKGRVTLPTGKEMIAEKTIGCPQWVTLLGMRVVDLKEPRMRCIYNIKSAEWAAENYMENIKFKSTGDGLADPNDKKSLPVTTASHLTGTVTPKAGDKLQCDTCSLQTSCKYYRQGAVCSVPGSEPAELAKHFKTRDSDMIIDGLGTLLALQTRRMEKGLSEEELYGELDPEVTKIANQLFSNGVKLAKLVNPQLNGGPRVQVNVNGGATAAIQASTPNQVMGAIVRELEARGVPRDKITPEMVANLVSEMGGAKEAPRAIEGTVLSQGA